MAARQVLIESGSSETDGFVFCVGLDRLHLSHDGAPHLQGRIYPVTNLIRDAMFRPRHQALQPPELESADSTTMFSLGICPFAGLIDMYHTRAATNGLDRVYALLGMACDDPGRAGILVDYEISWGQLFRKIIHYCLSNDMEVTTWDDQSIAVLRAKARILARVHTVHKGDSRADKQKIGICWVDSEKYESRFRLPASANNIRVDDVVCIFRGAANATIIRPSDGYAEVVLISPPLDTVHVFEPCVPFKELCPSDCRFPMKLALVWDWGNSDEQKRPQEGTTISDNRPPSTDP